MKQQSKDTLGDRMKQYEDEAFKHDGEISQNPIVIRLDGNSFHTWTRKMKLKTPFDERFILCMQNTLLHLCETIPSCVFGYTQSDEISLCLRNDLSENTEPWFKNRVQKLVSISASIATYKFNELVSKTFPSPIPAYFDSRVMFMPELDEVINNFIWRQNDCMRNSVSSCVQKHFPRKELEHKTTEERKELLKSINQNWDELPIHHQRGSFCKKHLVEGEYNGEKFMRNKFFIDQEPPIFSQNKEYLISSYLTKPMKKTLTIQIV